jgi:hypothetical protein
MGGVIFQQVEQVVLRIQAGGDTQQKEAEYCGKYILLQIYVVYYHL